ncbi:GvpL/GvpF family gas vesicle protein [Egibacter rhizosphaerae]|uniref:GvpL/GvpF family gas vesicle protein n=1 Tax=Egibacter rhizosphaerae TaxID=1670831 RepID=A0A411YBW5_9ACTN|nr:GvpL/GvpF family gas vesicle protein [Egibacter rhizosphaerae]QBI18686.1 GvpL/GvpF family gas vesicle protein [Egibacter rhizosphaerae]
MPYLVHGVSRKLQTTPATDLDVETVRHGPLVALVSPTPDEEALPTRANLLQHTRALERVGEHATVVPMRFGVVVPDLDTLANDYLAPQREQLLATLDRLDGHVELRLRGHYDEAKVIAGILRQDPRAAHLHGRTETDAKIELGERIVAGIDARRGADRHHARAALAPYPAAVVDSGTTETLDAFSLSFLVGRTAREPFDRAVDALGEELAPVIGLELVGPVPPFSFVTEEADAWA